MSNVVCKHALMSGTSKSIAEFLTDTIKTDEEWDKIFKYLKEFHPLCPVDKSAYAHIVAFSLAFGVTVNFQITDLDIDVVNFQREVLRFLKSDDEGKPYYLYPGGVIELKGDGTQGKVEYVWNDESWNPGTCNIKTRQGTTALMISEYKRPTVNVKGVKTDVKVSGRTYVTHPKYEDSDDIVEAPYYVKQSWWDVAKEIEEKNLLYVGMHPSLAFLKPTQTT